jgi:hypothetical protein
VSHNLASSGSASSNIAVGASAFVYQNTGLNPENVLVSGGTVTTIELSRDGSTFFVVGIIAGQFHLAQGDKLRVTYAVAPTMTRMPT